MTEAYTTDSVEGYFAYSHENGGDYARAGSCGHFVQWRLDDAARLLFVPLAEGEEETEIRWESRGIDCYISSSQVVDSRMCVVKCTNPDYHSVVNRIAASILQSGLIGARATIELFRRERSFWAGVPTLSPEKAVGLFGELYFLWKWLHPVLCKVMDDDQWTGPNDADKDFNLDTLQVEVKTTMSTASPRVHQISKLHQLQDDGRPLVLFSLIAHPDPGGQWSLSALVQLILDELKDSPQRIDAFVDRLKSVGYILHHPAMDEYRYALHAGDGELYAVFGEFPRLTSTDDAADDRVHIESYAITLSGVADLRMSLGAPTTELAILSEYRRIALNP